MGGLAGVRGVGGGDWMVKQRVLVARSMMKGRHGTVAGSNCTQLYPVVGKKSKLEAPA